MLRKYQLASCLIVWWLMAQCFCTVKGGCRDDGPPANGSRYPKPGGTEYSTGSKVGYLCRKGFIGQGTSPRLCQDNGMWTGQPFSCKKDRTPLDVCTLNIEKAMNIKVLPSCWDKSLCPAKVFNGHNLSESLNKKFAAGDSVTFFCDAGYSLVGQKSRKCLPNGRWSGIYSECFKNCPGIASEATNYGQENITFSSPAVGKFMGIPQFPYGTRATVKCRPGFCTADIFRGTQESYVLYSNAMMQCSYRRLMCQVGGNWDGQLNHTCIDRRCLQTFPPEPSNGRAVLYKNYYPEIHFLCNSGYTVLGSSVRRCLNGTWTGIDAWCTRIRCSRLRHPQNGRVHVSSVFLSSSATYKCNSGYYHIGNATRVCTETGLWSGNPGSCNASACKEPNPFLNGYYVGMNSSVVFSVVSVRCGEGYNLYGPKERQCQANLTWTGTEPSCISQKCSLPLPLKNGTYGFANSSVKYSCNPGFILRGLKLRECNESTGMWSETDPTCFAPIRCVDIQPVHGNRFPKPTHIHGMYDVGVRVSFSCNRGYKRAGTSPRICLGNGRWSGLPYSCRKDPEFCHFTIRERMSLSLVSTCQAHQQSSNLSHSPSYRSKYVKKTVDNSFAEGNSISISCEDGFTLQGQHCLTCQKDGNWDSRAKSCTANCPAIKYDDNHCKVSYSNQVVFNIKNEPQYSTSTVAKLNCEDGFCQERVRQNWLSGSTVECESWRDSFRCNDDGNWSGQFFPSIEIQCVKTVESNLQNGWMEYNATTTELEYRCLDGYALTGSATRRCKQGVWNGVLPRCTPIYCGDSPQPKNGTVQVSSDSLNGQAIYACNSGYQLIGNRKRICVAPGIWKGDIPFCNALPCPFPSYFANGYYERKNTSVGSVIRVFCHDGYNLYSSNERRCYGNKTWSGNDPSCLSVSCALPPKLHEADYYLRNGTAVYSCRQGFVLEGRKTQTCNPSTGLWSKDFFCRHVTCGNPGLVRNSTRIGDKFDLESVVQYNCYEGFGLVGKTSISCTVNGTWSGALPQCVEFLAVNCGPPRNITDGSVNGRAYGYGNKVTYSCNDDFGFAVDAIIERKCLIDGTWDGKEPTCYPLCPALSSPDPFGWKHGSERRKGSAVQFGCGSDKKLVGSATRVCQDDGSWNGTTTKCLYTWENDEFVNPHAEIIVVAVVVALAAPVVIILVIFCACLKLHSDTDCQLRSTNFSLLHKGTRHRQFPQYHLLSNRDIDEDEDNTTLGFKFKNKCRRREYDVFYSYSNQDKEWVQNKLIKELEEKYSFKGLEHSRDFPGGEYVVKNISRAVKTSRKTVAVLTPSYVESKWCQYEAVNAMATAMSDKLDACLIPIMLEQCEVPGYMRHITYIDVKEEKFWEKLVQSLKTQTRTFTISETISAES